jgi:hypothetical protein
MAISENNRNRFENIGLASIRRELAVGSIQFLGLDEGVRAQAKEWISEQDEKVRQEKQEAKDLEAQRFNTIRRWTVIAALAGVVAAIAAVIAALK